ncbi:MAG: hypothetical protein JJU11_12085, partial [Candidatus Sumerlaeia bacterium]|nr:hypothetical protein [Candidatus Sumerlaeia bacterium]
AVLGGVVLMVFVSMWLQPVRGDEASYYESVLNAAVETWPAVSPTHNHHGVSPGWLFQTGIVGKVTGDGILGGRLLWFCFLVGAWGVLRWGRVSCRWLGLAAVAFLHPLVLTYAIRAHPFVPALFFLLLAAMLTRRGHHPAVVALVLAVAVNFQQNLAAIAPAFLLLRMEGGWLEPLRRGTWACVGAGAGLAANWVFFGMNLHPDSFYDTELFHRYWIEGTHPVNFGYGALMIAMMGFYWWWAWGRLTPNRSGLGWGWSAVLGAGVVAVLLFHELPLGPMKSALERLPGDGLARLMWLVLLLVATLGWSRAPRSVVPLVIAALLLQGVFFSLLPLWFERFAWWGTAAVLILMAAVRGEESGEPPAWVIPLAGAIGLIGFVVYAFMGRL